MIGSARERSPSERSLVAFGSDEERGVFALGRAMGGYSGRWAADIAVETFLHSSSPGASGLVDAVLEAHRVLVREVAEENHLRIGTSAGLVAIQYDGDAAFVVHAGDCQAFAVEARPASSSIGRLCRLTESHLLVRTRPGTSPHLSKIVESTLGFASHPPTVTCTRWPHLAGTVYVLVSDAVRDEDLIEVVKGLPDQITPRVEELAHQLYARCSVEEARENSLSREHLESTLGVMAIRFD